MSGRAEEEVSIPSRSTLAVLLESLASRHSRLKKLDRSVKLALNEEIAERGRVLKDGDVVALLPPVAGGRE